MVAHVPLTSASVTHFVETKHYRRDYLYAESSGGKSVTLIDVTDVSRPAILSTVSAPSGNAALYQPRVQQRWFRNRWPTFLHRPIARHSAS